MKLYSVKHNILEADCCIFPGCGDSQMFHYPERWPQSVKDTMKIAGELAIKYSLKLLKGEVNIKENVTVLEIEAES